MNSTERLLACLHGEIPDRVPINTYELVGWNADAWENRQPSYARLMEFIRQHTDCIYMTRVGVPNAVGDRWPIQRRQWDEGDQHITETTIQTPGRKLTGRTSHSDTVMTTWVREHLCKDLDDVEAYLDLPWEPGEADFTRLEKAWADLGLTAACRC